MVNLAPDSLSGANRPGWTMQLYHNLLIPASMAVSVAFLGYHIDSYRTARAGDTHAASSALHLPDVADFL